MFRFLKRNDSEVITPEVVDVPVMTIQSNIAMALALCMEEYLRSVSKTSVDIPFIDNCYLTEREISEKKYISKRIQHVG